MLFRGPLVQGTVVRRYQRFFVDVALDDGPTVTAHCANTGSMKTCLEPGTRAWLSEARPGRKLLYTWEVAECAGTRIYVNPAGANHLVAEAVTKGSIAELWGYSTLRREVKYGTGSRIDLLLEGDQGRAFVEVKNVTLLVGPGRAAFPDAVTERGRKHIEELILVTKAGARGVLVFCVARTDVRSFEPADAIDPGYGAALRRAHAAGVEILAYGVDINEQEIRLTERLPIEMR